MMLNLPKPKKPSTPPALIRGRSQRAAQRQELSKLGNLEPQSAEFNVGDAWEETNPEMMCVSQSIFMYCQGLGFRVKK